MVPHLWRDILSYYIHQRRISATERSSELFAHVSTLHNHLVTLLSFDIPRKRKTVWFRTDRNMAYWRSALPGEITLLPLSSLATSVFTSPSGKLFKTNRFFWTPLKTEAGGNKEHKFAKQLAPWLVPFRWSPEHSIFWDRMICHSGRFEAWQNTSANFKTVWSRFGYVSISEQLDT